MEWRCDEAKDVVLDDRKARRCAQRLGATVRGRLACLLIAEGKQEKFANSELFLW